MNKLKPYPTLVCRDCGLEASNKKADDALLGSTFHQGRCDVCERITAVTEPRDYGYPKFEGHENVDK